MLMYACPALMDWLLFYVLFAVLYSAGLHGASLWECTLLGAVLQAAYMPGSVIAGYLLNASNAKKILAWSALASGGVALACLALSGFLALILSMALFGFASAFFFNSFQTFMRSEASLGMTLKASVSKYNFAWSVGAGAGSLTAGSLYALGTGALMAAAALSIAAILALLAVHKPSGESRTVSDGVIEEGSPAARPVSNSYVAVGWLMVFTALFIQRPLCTFLPPLFAGEGTSSLLASLPLFGMLALQALVALFMWRLRDQLYRRTPFWIVQAAAALGFVAIWLWPEYLVCLLVLLLMGVYGGFVFFCAVYYVSNSKRSSFNIGVNEALVGLGSIAGIFAGDWWMRSSSSSSSIYLMCACGLGLSLLLQVALASFGVKGRGSFSGGAPQASRP